MDIASVIVSTLLLALFAQPRLLASSVFLGWAEGPGGETISVYGTCDLELSDSELSRSGIRFHSLQSFKSKMKTRLISSAYLSVSFFLIVSTHHQ